MNNRRPDREDNFRQPGYKRPRLNEDQGTYSDRQGYHFARPHDQQERLQDMGQRKLEEVDRSLRIRVDEKKFKTIACIHYLKNSCKFRNNPEQCPFLHTNEKDKIPMCPHQQKHGFCRNEDTCVYNHNKDEDAANFIGNDKFSVESLCPYYERGYCYRSDKNCRLVTQKNPLAHFALMTQKICLNYIAGFCPMGPDCQFKHLKNVIIDDQTSLKDLGNFPTEENHWQPSTVMQPMKWNGFAHKPIMCHNCGKEGHKSTYCLEDKIDPSNLALIQGQSGIHDRVLCFNCSKYGHYANMCPEKGLQQNPMGRQMNPEQQQPILENTSMPPPTDLPAKRQTTKVFSKGTNLKEMSKLPFGPKELNFAIKDFVKSHRKGTY